MQQLQQETEKKSKKNFQVTFGLALALIILGLIIYLVIRPNFGKATALNSEIKTNEELLGRLKRKSTNLTKAQQNFQAIANDQEIIDQAIGNYSNVPEAMLILEKLAAEIIAEGGPLVIETARISSMPNDTPETLSREFTSFNMEETQILVNLFGDYQAIRDFVYKLKELRHNFYLEKIVFSAPKSTEQSQFLDVNLTLKYYYFN